MGLLGPDFGASGRLIKADFKRDLVYLYQFSRPKVMPNYSPFALKVEAFLRHNNISYEAVGSLSKRSKQGRIPFVELNGEQIPDSQVILWHLKKHFNVNDGLSPQDEAVARTVDRMVEMSTFPAVTYFRWIDPKVESAVHLLDPKNSGVQIPKPFIKLAAKAFQKKVKGRLVTEGTARLPRAAILEVFRKDMAAINTILGNKQYLFGDKITTCDLSVFAHLAVAFYSPVRLATNDVLENEFPALAKYLNRIKAIVFPDWPEVKQ